MKTKVRTQRMPAARDGATGGPPYPESKAFFDFVFQMYMQRRGLSDPRRVRVMEIYRHAGYSGSFSRHWRTGNENFNSISKLLQLCDFLQVDPVICLDILRGEIDAARAVELALNRDRLRAYRKERELRSPVEERIAMSFSDRLRLKLMSVLNNDGHDAAEYFDTREVAELFKVSQRTVQWWIDTGKLDSAKTSGGHARIAYRQIVDFIETHGVYNPLAVFVNRKLFIIDGHDAGRRICAAFEGFSAIDVHCCADVESGLLQIGATRPGFVVLVERKGFDITAALRTLRRIDGYHPQLLIVIGARPQWPRWRAAGADHTLPRDFSSDEVRKLIVESERQLLSRPRGVRRAPAGVEV